MGPPRHYTQLLASVHFTSSLTLSRCLPWLTYLPPPLFLLSPSLSTPQGWRAGRTSEVHDFFGPGPSHLPLTAL